MAQHLTSRELKHLLTGQGSAAELDIHLDHLLDCRECWHRGVSILGEVPSGEKPARRNDEVSALIRLLKSEESKALTYLRSRSWWARIRDFDLEVQQNRLKTSAELRNYTFFRIVLEGATAAGFSDPFRGEQEALLARDIAALLPRHEYSSPLRADLEGEALTVVANCRRLATNWQGSMAAIREANKHFERGTGNRVRQAKLLSIHASLACDIGRLEAAMEILSRAAVLFKEEGELDGLAGIIIQEAAISLIAGHAEEAIGRVNEIFAIGPALSTRLEMIARSLMTEALIVVGREREALLAYHRSRKLYVQYPDFGLRVGYLEGRLLDALGYEQDAELLLRQVAEANWHGEQYKEAFRTLYSLFEILYKRGHYSKAESLCSEALSWIDLAGEACHEQIRLLWHGLGDHVRKRLLNEMTLSAVRLYLIRNWSSPASNLPFDEEARHALAISSVPDLFPLAKIDAAEAAPENWISDVARPTMPDDLVSGAYLDAVDRYDRDLILAGLAQCNSEIKPTARFLGISRNTLRNKMRKYGIGGR